jgi:hypothetical protein
VKKILVLLLLIWMPVQASLAAFEEVHVRHDRSAIHGSLHHHDANLVVYVALFDEVNEATHDQCSADCHTHHLCMAQLLCIISSGNTTFEPRTSDSFLALQQVHATGASERPERPQWSSSSH